MVSFINKLSKNIVKGCFLVFALVYSVANLLFTTAVNRTTYNTEFNFTSIFNILFLIFFILLLYYLIKKEFFKINDYKLLIFFLIMCLILGTIWILINDVELKDLDDSYNCYHAALNVLNGNYESLSYASYLSVYPNNIGYFTYLLVNLKIFGSTGTLYSIRFINLLFVLLGYLALYGITNLLFKDQKTNYILIYLMFLNIQYVFDSFIMYGNCPSYSLALISIYYLLKYFENGNPKHLVFTIVTIVCSITIKNNSLIILIAEIIYLFIHFLNNKKISIILSIFLMLLGTYLGTSGLQKYWGNKVDINYNDTKLPTICWLAYGLNYNQDRPGSYTSQFENYHAQNGYVKEYTQNEAKTFIDGILNDFKNKPSLIFRFYSQKFLASFTSPTYDCFDYYKELDNNTLVKEVTSGNLYIMFTNIFDSGSSIIAIGLVLLILKEYKKIELKQAILMCIVFGGFLFHAFWEVKAIYLYQYFMYLLPLGAYGISKNIR